MSELTNILTFEKFENMYSQFLEQADKNAISGKSQGPRTPFGFSPQKGGIKADGAVLSQHFGQGAASKTPYISWYVVSVYYIVDIHSVVIGIEKDRYPNLNKMTPKGIRHIGNKNISIASFYSTNRNNIDYKELYENFINVCEEVMELGVFQ